MWNVDGMTMSEENGNTWRKTCPGAILFTINPIWNGLGLNLALHGVTLVTNHLTDE
jgi:hypothetical protein